MLLLLLLLWAPVPASRAHIHGRLISDAHNRRLFGRFVEFPLALSQNHPPKVYERLVWRGSLFLLVLLLLRDRRKSLLLLRDRRKSNIIVILLLWPRRSRSFTFRFPQIPFQTLDFSERSVEPNFDLALSEGGLSS